MKKHPIELDVFYQVCAMPEDPLAKVELLMIAPMSVLRNVLDLHPDAQLRVQKETFSGGVSQVFFNGRAPSGFRHLGKVIIGRFDERRLSIHADHLTLG